MDDPSPRIAECSVARMLTSPLFCGRAPTSYSSIFRPRISRQMQPASHYWPDARNRSTILAVTNTSSPPRCWAGMTFLVWSPRAFGNRYAWRRGQPGGWLTSGCRPYALRAQELPCWWRDICTGRRAAQPWPSVFEIRTETFAGREMRQRISRDASKRPLRSSPQGSGGRTDRETNRSTNSKQMLEQACPCAAKSAFARLSGDGTRKPMST